MLEHNKVIHVKAGVLIVERQQCWVWQKWALYKSPIIIIIVIIISSSSVIIIIMIIDIIIIIFIFIIFI